MMSRFFGPVGCIVVELVIEVTFPVSREPLKVGPLIAFTVGYWAWLLPGLF